MTLSPADQRVIADLRQRLSQIERNVEPTRTHGVGEVWAFAGVGVPSGSLIADGTAVSRTKYPSLFAAIGTSWGSGDGSTTFNLPDLRGRTLVSADSSQSEFNIIGERGGEKTHTLSISEMPSHTHTQNAHNHSQNAHNHSQKAHSHGGIKVGSSGLQWTGGYQTSSGNRSGLAGGTSNLSTDSATAANNATTATNNATTATNQNTGGGGAHNNLQPYAVVRYMIAF